MTARSQMLGKVFYNGKIVDAKVCVEDLTAQEVAAFLSEEDVDPERLDARVPVEAVEFAHRIADGSFEAAMHLVAVGLVEDPKSIDGRLVGEKGSATKTKAPAQGSTQSDINTRAVRAMIRALIQSEIIEDEKDPKVQGKTTKEVAELLSSAQVKARHMKDDVVKKAVKLAGKIANGQKDVTKELAEYEEKALIKSVKREKKKFKNTRMTDPGFNRAIKQIFLLVLIEANKLKTGDDPEVRELTAQQVAKLVARASLDPTQFNSPLIRRAIKLAQGVATGSVDDARELAAVSSAVLEQKARDIKFRLRKKSLRHGSFAKRVWAVLVRVLIESGHIRDENDPSISGMSAQTLAAHILKLKIDPSRMPDATTRKAVENAHRISKSKSDAAKDVVALAQAELSQKMMLIKKDLNGKDLKDANFNQEVKTPLLQAILSGGLVQDKRDSRVLGKTAQELAGLLRDGRLKRENMPDDVSADAVEKSAAIAAGNSIAAQELVARFRAAIEAKAKYEKDRLRAKTLKQSGFGAQVRDIYIRVLIEGGIIESVNDHLVRGKSAAEVAKIVVEKRVPESKMQSQATMRAVRVAQAVANGSNYDARQIVAVDAVEDADEVAVVKRTLHKLSLKKDKQFNTIVSNILIRALIATGAVKSADDESVRDKTAKDLAKMLEASNANADTMKSRVLAAAVRLAKEIAKKSNAAAQQLLAQNEVELNKLARLRELQLGGKGLNDQNLNDNVFAVLLNALRRSGIIRNSEDPEIQHLRTAEDLARFVSEQEDRLKDSDDRLVQLALKLSKSIADGNSANAKALLCFKETMDQQQVDDVKRAIDPEAGLDDPLLNKKIKQALKIALVEGGVIRDASDPKTRDLTVQQLAQLLAQQRLNPNDMKSPISRAAVKLAVSIGESDVQDGKELAAIVIARDTALTKLLKRQVMSDPKFAKHMSTKDMILKMLARAVMELDLLSGTKDKKISGLRLNELSEGQLIKLLKEYIKSGKSNDDISDETRAVLKLAPSLTKNIAELLSMAQAREEKNEAIQRETIKDQSPKDDKFERKLRQVLIYVLLKLGIISSFKDQKIAGQGVKELASLLFEQGEKVLAKFEKSTGDAVVRRCIVNIQQLSEGDSDAARSVMASFFAAFQEKVNLAMHALQKKTLADSAFARQVQRLLVLVLVELRIVSGKDDTKVRGKTVQELAQLLLDAEVDEEGQLFANPVVRFAVEHAEQLSKGDVRDARRLVAVSQVQLSEARDEIISEINLPKSWKKDKPTQNSLKRITLRALIESGVIESEEDEAVMGLSLSKLLKMLINAKDVQNRVESAVGKALVRLVVKIMKGSKDAVVELLATDRAVIRQKAALEMIALRDKSLKDASFNREAANILLRALLKLKIIQSTDDKRVVGKSAQELARLLQSAKEQLEEGSAGKKKKKKKSSEKLESNDSVISKAIQLCDSIASGDEDAAKLLVATNKARFKELAKQKQDGMKLESLRDVSFADRVKSVLLRALLAAKVIKSVDDQKVRGLRVQKIAELVKQSKIDLKKISDPVLRLAVEKAAEIADGNDDAAREVVAAEDTQFEQAFRQQRDQLGGQSMSKGKKKNPEFDWKVTKPLLRALMQAGVVKGEDDPQIVKKSKLKSPSALVQLLRVAVKDGTVKMSSMKDKVTQLAWKIASNLPSKSSQLNNVDARDLVAMQLALEKAELDLKKQELQDQSLSDQEFNDDVQQILIRMLKQIGKITSKDDPAVEGKTAQEIADYIKEQNVTAGGSNDEVLKAVISLADAIAKGSSEAARELVALSTISFEEGVKNRARKMQNKSLDDAEFNREVQKALVQVLLSLEAISGPSDSKVFGKSAAEVAQLIIKMNLDISSIKDKLVQAAIKFAVAIYKGDSEAARNLVATAQSVREQRVEDRASSVDAVFDKKARKFSPNVEKTLKSIFLEILEKTGRGFSGAEKETVSALIFFRKCKHSGCLCPVKKRCPKKQKCLACAIKPEEVPDAISRLAIGLAKRISKGDTDAAKELYARFSVQSEEDVKEARGTVQDVSLQKPLVNNKIKNALVQALIEAGIIKDKRDPLVRDKTAVEVAKLVARLLENNEINPSDVTDPGASEALKQAKKLSQFDKKALIEVMSKIKATEKRRIEGIIESLKGQGLSNPVFNAQVKELLLQTLERLKIISGRTDSQVFEKPVQEIAGLLASESVEEDNCPDDVSAAAVKFARPISEGSTDAAQQLVAVSEAVFKKKLQLAVQAQLRKDMEEEQNTGKPKKGKRSRRELAAGKRADRKSVV